MESEALDRFCGSTFWNLSLTWNTEDPEFTKCFDKTVLVWVPCLFLWVFSYMEFYYIARSKRKDIPWSWNNIAKLFITLSLIALCVTDYISAKNNPFGNPEADVYAPIVKGVTFVLSAILLLLGRKYGLQSSGLQFIFWLLLAICGAPLFRTHIMGSQRDIGPDTHYLYFSYLNYYFMVLIMFVLNWFADNDPRKTPWTKTKKPCPEDGSSFPARLLFTFFDRLAWLGFKKPLITKDLWDIRPDDSAKEVSSDFEKNWNHTLKKYEGFTIRSSEEDLYNDTNKKQASIMPALWKSFGSMFVFAAVLKLGQDILTFVSPQVLRWLISHVKEGKYEWKGYLYAFLLFATASFQTIILAQHFYKMNVIGMRIRIALIATIYRKALKISNAARKESSVGEIVNLMAVDAQKFIELAPLVNVIWSAPITIALALYFLWQELGPSVLSGLAFMIILIPVNGYIANLTKKLQVKQMRYKDERVKLMNEILSGIKVLKLYAWEPSYEEQIAKIRNKEIEVLKKSQYLQAVSSFIWALAPFMVSLVTFATYVLLDDNNILDASKAYVSISLFNILKFPLSILPTMISNLIQAYVSVERINKFMNAEELDPNNVSHDKHEMDVIVVENGTFSWGEESVLKKINIRVPKNTLAAVVGTVGSGKTSLIGALLGEMDKESGRVNTRGDVAYVAQQAWIQNATLRDNITFGKDFDRKTYEMVIEACALKTDFEMLPAGDQTEIGEKGINLSGGQKQRVSLARAVYADADIYLLDDPLSAVDSHVGKHIFEKVIGPDGILKDKTRVLVTHGITYLPWTDQILVLKRGRISESGTYQELLDKKGDFSEFLTEHINESVENEDELEELKTQLEGTDVSVEIEKKIQRQRSRVSESVSEVGSEKRYKSNSSLDLRGSSLSLNKSSKPKRGEKLIEAESSATGKVGWAVYKHYLATIGLCLAFSSILLNITLQGFSIGSNIWIGIWSEDETLYVNGTVDHAKRNMYLATYGAFGVGQGLSQVIYSLILVVGFVTAAQKQHNTLLHCCNRWPMAFFDTTPLGRVLNRFSNDINTLDNALPANMQQLVRNLFQVVGTLVVISYSSPWFMVVVVPIGIVYYFIQSYYVATSRQLKRLESVSRSPIYSYFGETVTGAPCIRAFGLQDKFILECERKIDNNQVCYFPTVISNRWLGVRLEMIGNAIILFAALFAVLSKDQMPGLVGLSITYALQITSALNWLVRMTTDVETNIVAVERIKEYSETPQEAPWNIPNKTPAKNWPDKGTIEFRNYAVRYRPGLDLVLRGLNFTVKGGEKVGIVGRTGAGKSSLTLSLFRLIEASQGDIYIDNVKVSELGLHDLRSRLTIIPQDAVLFSGSLRMNLDPFEKHTDDQVWRALEHAHLKDFVRGLAAGLQHEVTEGGENLSVGQRQLICLARALLRKTKVLLLDEATAAVDLETDDLIQNTIRSEFKECTVLTIAHRLNTIMDSDRVLVLDKGKVVEFDSPSNLLLNTRSIFYSMCKDAGLA